MKPNKPRNIAASHRAKLLALAHERKENFQFLLGRWVVERFLFRLSQSEHADQFVLKGAMLFIAWEGKLHRPTKDLDLLGYGSPEVEGVVKTVREVCSAAVDDGLRFDLAAVEGWRIKEDAEYEGVRVKVPASLDGARVQMQIDIGFGDLVEPAPKLLQFPVLLPMDAPMVRAYPPEAVVAEKFHAMVLLGIANSRMKDFYDIWMLASSHTFEMDPLARAIRGTFERRRTGLPRGVPFAFTAEFLEDASKQTQWRAFVARLGLVGVPAELKDIGRVLAGFLLPVTEAAGGSLSPYRLWTPPGTWV